MKRLTLLVLLVLLTLLSSCAKREASPMASGAIVQQLDVFKALPGFVGDGPYAVVKAEALPGFYDAYRTKLFDEGVTKWDTRFDCNHFASYYVAYAQTQYYRINFQSSTTAQTLALAEVWYRRGGTGGGHAIVAALTDQGLLFIEPQNGATVTLTPAERSSIILCKW